ncbi:MAG: hypothetical protein OEY97_00685 [Nitrospirota bacterium]|nr:hypothetical protein [Nitrospirota bacterium]
MLHQLRESVGASQWFDGAAVRGVTPQTYLSNLIKSTTRPFALVIDRMEKARPALQAEILKFLDLTGPAMVPVFISRTPPPRGLGGLHGSGEMRVIGWRQLRLTRREGAAVARAWGWGRPPAAMIDRLLADSGGWVGGFVLLLDQVRDRRDRAGDPGRSALAAYFTSSVLTDLGAAAARFNPAGSGATTSNPLDAPRWPWRVRITTLGMMSVDRADAMATPSGLRGPRSPLRLLQLLIANGPKGISQDELIATMWPKAHPVAGSRSLGTTLHRLRKSLDCDACVERTQGQVRLNPGVAWVDAWIFERRIAQAEALPPSEHNHRRRLVDEALAMYRGRFLADVSAPWADSMRDRLHTLYVTHLRERMEEMEKAAEWNKLEQACLSGLEADPLCEPFCQGLMSARISLGRTSEAVAAFDRLKTALKQTLGTQPSPELLSLYGRLKPFRE